MTNKQRTYLRQQEGDDLTSTVRLWALFADEIKGSLLSLKGTDAGTVFIRYYQEISTIDTPKFNFKS